MIYLIIKAKYRDENSQLLFNNFISIFGNDSNKKRNA